jgi:hypothetical protein
MNDLRDRALRAAREQAEQRERETAAAKAAAEAVQAEEDRQLIAEAEAVCEQTLGMKAAFRVETKYRYLGNDESEPYFRTPSQRSKASG